VDEWFHAFLTLAVDSSEYIQGRIYARAQGGILKRIEIEVRYAGGKKGCPRERNLREIFLKTL
jgi:hypothetical protein